MPALATARILTVEDDPIVRVDLRLILEDAGYEVGHVLRPFSETQLAETLAGVLTPRAERDEWERRSQLIMIESMLRAGYSEREIASALREAAGEPPTTETVRSLAGRFRAFLGSAF